MSVAKNYIYNVLYQIMALIIPLVTVPYVSAILGADGVGINAYSFSIAQYFVLFGMIGVNLYGNRTIATVRDDSKNLNKKFWEIYLIQLTTCTIVAIIYIVFVSIFVKENKYIYIIQTLYIISAAIDISWLFMGLEEFKKTVTRNTLVKIIGVICIFTFVRSSTDLILYVAILAISNFLGQLVLWGHVGKIINLKYIKLIKLNNVVKNLLPMIVLFAPQIAVQIYTVLNKTMLGAMSTNAEVGIYENSDKIIKMTLAIVTSLGTVMLPRISNEFSKGNLDKVNNYIYKSINFVSIIAIPISFGIASISKEFVGWFLPNDFYKCSIVIPIISPIIIFIAWSNVLGIQYMLPTGKNREFTISLTVGAVINLVLNFFLIINLKSVGAGIATVVSEAVVTVIQIYILRKDLKFSVVVPEICKYFFAAGIMAIIVRVIGDTFGISIITTIIQITFGGLLYGIILILFKASLINDIKILMKKKLKKI